MIRRSDISVGHLSCLGLSHSQRSQAPLGKLKAWRTIATRYEKRGNSFMSVPCLAAILDWLKI